MTDAECLKCGYYGAAGQCKIGIHDERGYYFLWDVGYLGGGSSIAPFVATPCRVVRQMLSLAELKPDEVVYDLGSGDGRIVLLAAGEFGAQAIGFEQEEELVKKTWDKILAVHLEDRVRVIHDDLFNADIHRADVVTMYLSPTGNREVKPKLERELRSDARVVSLEFEIPEWTPSKIDKIIDDSLTYTIYLYRR